MCKQSGSELRRFQPVVCVVYLKYKSVLPPWRKGGSMEEGREGGNERERERERNKERDLRSIC